MIIGHGWQVFISTSRPETHVMPVDDYRPHQFTSACWCGAKPDDEDVITHNSLDHREMFEDLPLQ